VLTNMIPWDNKLTSGEKVYETQAVT